VRVVVSRDEKLLVLRQAAVSSTCPYQVCQAIQCAYNHRLFLSTVSSESALLFCTPARIHSSNSNSRSQPFVQQSL